MLRTTTSLGIATNLLVFSTVASVTFPAIAQEPQDSDTFIVIDSQVSEADVYIDDNKTPEKQGRIAVPAGTHQVRLEAKDCEAESRQVEVEQGSTQLVTFMLKCNESDAIGASENSQVPPPPEVAPVPKTQDSQMEDSPIIPQATEAEENAEKATDEETNKPRKAILFAAAMPLGVGQFINQRFTWGGVSAGAQALSLGIAWYCDMKEKEDIKEGSKQGLVLKSGDPEKYRKYMRLQRNLALGAFAAIWAGSAAQAIWEIYQKTPQTNEESAITIYPGTEYGIWNVGLHWQF